MFGDRLQTRQLAGFFVFNLQNGNGILNRSRYTVPAR